MKMTINQILMVLLCVAFVSCGSKPDPETVSKNAVREAEREVDEMMLCKDAPNSPFFLKYRYPVLIEQQRVALNKSFNNIDKSMRVDEKVSPDNKNAYKEFMANHHIADSLKRVARDYIRDHYRQPIEEAIAEIAGMEFPCSYNNDYVQRAQAFVERDPNDSQGQSIRLRVEMTLERPSLNHTVFYIMNGVPSTPGYGSTRAAKFFRIGEGNKHKYDAGTSVQFFIPMQSSAVIAIENLYIKECKYR